jgi:hypothetical protein
MSRRAVGAALVTSALLGLSPSYAASPQLPDPACDKRVVDGTGDGKVNWNVNPQSTDRIDDPRGSVDALDITGVTIRLTATKVYAFMTLKDVPAAVRETDTAYGYFMWFTRGTKIARFQHVLVNSAQSAIGPTNFPTASVGTSTNGGTGNMSGLGGGIDPGANVVYVYADRSALETQLGAPLVEGDQLTAVTGKTYLFIAHGTVSAGVQQRLADETTAKPEDAVYTVGQNPCFAPSKVEVTSPTVQYGDPVTLTATLADAADSPLAERQVTFTIPGEAARTVTTGDDGVATVALTTARAAGAYRYTVTYGGDDYSGTGTGEGTLTVAPEGVRLSALKVTKPTATSRTVTTTLTDDDAQPLAKQAIVWYVAGKKVATVLTDVQGKSVFKGAKPGQKVQAKFAGVSGRYLAAASNTVTA